MLCMSMTLLVRVSQCHSKSVVTALSASFPFESFFSRMPLMNNNPHHIPAHTVMLFCSINKYNSPRCGGEGEERGSYLEHPLMGGSGYSGYSPVHHLYCMEMLGHLMAPLVLSEPNLHCLHSAHPDNMPPTLGGMLCSTPLSRNMQFILFIYYSQRRLKTRAVASSLAVRSHVSSRERAMS